MVTSSAPCKNACPDGSRLISVTLCLASAQSYGVLQRFCEPFSERGLHVEADRDERRSFSYENRCHRSEVHSYSPPAGTLVRLEDMAVILSITSRWQHCSIPKPPSAPERNIPVSVAETS